MAKKAGGLIINMRKDITMVVGISLKGSFLIERLTYRGLVLIDPVPLVFAETLTDIEPAGRQ